MDTHKERLRYLLHAYVHHHISAEEFLELKSYVTEQYVEADFYAVIDDLWAEVDVDQPLPVSSDLIFKKIVNDPRISTSGRLPVTAQRNVTIKRFWFAVASVAAVFCIAFSFYAYFRYDGYRYDVSAHANKSAAESIIKPGSQKAMLTLADGRVISLEEVAEGDLAEQAGVRIVKTDNGQLFYESVGSADSNGEMMYNTVHTPRGGEYQLALPDGTKVWLNAMSSLRYPVHFSGDVREVELTGEAYFEVSRFQRDNVQLPFIVKTGDQTVEVLGTHFNVKAYPGEKITKTTLLEGKVRVSIPEKTSGAALISNVLVPNQQSAVKHGSRRISIAAVDATNAIAWKSGNFAFHDNDMVEVMNTIARWYDVEVEYEKEAVKEKRFGGTISRFESFEKLLRTIELTGTVKFRIEGRRVIVMT